MKVRMFEGLVGSGDVARTATCEVAEGQSVVFLTPSVINPVVHARFYDVNDQLHQVPAEQIVSIEP